MKHVSLESLNKRPGISNYIDLETTVIALESLQLISNPKFRQNNN